ncbi:MAG: S-layer homology domain-containing protein [Clostridia bacterium]|nr:S-layer homology domain-containing protein [Clostridia bacterium]
MKKNFRKILCGMICLVMMLSTVNVFAATPMQIEWSGDYSNSAKPKLNVTFTTPAEYVQQVTAVIYDKDITSPVSSDFVRITELTVSDGETKDVVFNVTNAFSEADGAYTLRLKGSGHMQDECVDSATVYVIKPAVIPGLLNEFKGATSVTFGGVLDKVAPALQLEGEADASRKIKRIDIMLNIQASDFEGEFKNLEDVRDAWKISDIIAYITDSGATAEGLKSRIESNKDLLAIDTGATDYVTYIDNVCQDIINYSAEYNGNAGVKSLNDLKGIIKQYTGLRAVNGANEDTLYGVFEAYKNYFELPEESFNKYNGFARETRDKALRLLIKKNFVKNSDLVTAFIEGVNTAETAEDTPTTPPVIIIPPTTGGGNGNGGAISGDVSAPTTPTQPTVPTFIDVPASHWANSYVTALASKKIINGYDDNTFKPNNNVTREEFVKMIVGATGILTDGAECEFNDVAKTAWYYEFIASAYSAGVVSGITDTAFGVGRNITRQDVAVIAARIIQYLKPGTTAPADTTLTDIDTVSDYAVSSVKLLNGMGIINGFDDGSFMPHNALTRAEAATIISKLADSL